MLDHRQLEAALETLPDWINFAFDITTGDRRRDYGHPLTNFLRIAIRWTTWLETRSIITITPLDVVVMMEDTKIAREMQTPKEDNWLDMIGYLFCAAYMHQRMKVLGYEQGLFAFYEMKLVDLVGLLERSRAQDLLDKATMGVVEALPV